jgi:hypothetical protein
MASIQMAPGRSLSMTNTDIAQKNVEKGRAKVIENRNKIRVAIINMIYIILSEFEAHELRFIRSPVNILYSHLSNPGQWVRNRKQELQVNFKKFSFSILGN